MLIVSLYALAVDLYISFVRVFVHFKHPLIDIEFVNIVIIPLWLFQGPKYFDYISYIILATAVSLDL